MKKRSGAVHNTPGVDGSRHWHHVGIVAALIAAALGLRLWGISFGLPHVYHYDEHFYINTALNLGAGVLHNPPYAATGLPNMLFPQYAGYYAVSRVLGSVTSAAEFEGLYRTDPTVFYLLARGTVAVFGAATIAAVYKVGKAGAGTTTGLIAAGFLACSFIHVRDSHYAVPDAAVPFFVTLAVALAAYTVHTGKRRPAYLASLVGGLAVAMKWTALPVALPVLWASVRSGTGQRQSRVLSGSAEGRSLAYSSLHWDFPWARRRS